MLGVLGRLFVESSHPVIVLVHLTAPRLSYLDKGKSKVALPHLVGTAISGMLSAVTAKWTRQRRADIRSASALARRLDVLASRKRVSQKEACYEVMEEAYLKASDGGSAPVNPRQIYYALRKQVLERTGRESFSGSYFSQNILVEYVNETGVDWDIVWDDRGHFVVRHGFETPGCACSGGQG